MLCSMKGEGGWAQQNEADEDAPGKYRPMSVTHLTCRCFGPYLADLHLARGDLKYLKMADHVKIGGHEGSGEIVAREFRTWITNMRVAQEGNS